LAIETAWSNSKMINPDYKSFYSTRRDYKSRLAYSSCIVYFVLVLNIQLGTKYLNRKGAYSAPFLFKYYFFECYLFGVCLFLVLVLVNLNGLSTLALVTSLPLILGTLANLTLGRTFPDLDLVFCSLLLVFWYA
jgi:hypothetical protein